MTSLEPHEGAEPVAEPPGRAQQGSARAEHPEARLLEVRRRRGQKVLVLLFSAAAIAQVLFASFAFGHSRGPVPLKGSELVLGIGLAGLLGVAAAALLAPRRLRKGARLEARLGEGRHRRRVVMFDDYFLIGREIVLYETVRVARQEGERLILRYIDPRFEGPVLRELEGPEELVRAVAEQLGRSL